MANLYKYDSLKIKRKNSFIIAPLVTNGPETSWAFGAASAYIFRTDKSDTSLRASTFPIGILYTLNNQIIGGLGANIFFPKEAYIFRFESSFSKFPDKFWGLGNKTESREAQFEKYTFTQIFLNPQFYKKIKKNLFVGIGYNLQTVFDINTNLPRNALNNTQLPESYFITDNVVGIANNPYTNYFTSGIEAIFNYDSRNNAYIPDKGELIRLRFSQFYKFTLSDYNFVFFELDYRKFIKVGKKSTFGFNSYMMLTFGEVPFRNLPSLGGRNNMRGYYDGRFRDKKFFCFQGEYRFPIWWRFSGVGFLGFGRVANKLEDFVSNGTNFSLDGFKISFGGGLRFAILPKEKLNIRVDYGFGIVGPGAFSIVLAEAF